ncbi:MAG: thioredoxin domain-containing protein [Gammaproteobacteria bacterium]
MRNRLNEETSPYLLQHADNPVHWQPWDQSALSSAVEQNKPILLSVGYSACHWCHVMAHESFEDQATADVMNEHFVNIKLDREERPDLDQIYQLAHQMLTQRGGGWPLTMFLTPGEHIPFFGGTYFPPNPAHGLPAFSDILVRVADFFHNHKDKIAEQSESLMQVFRDSSPQPEGEVELSGAPLHGASRALLGVFDATHGGFGGAPKFPQSPSLERLMRTWRRSAFDSKPDLQSLFAVSQTLTQMARGGLFDQLGGGFYRYSIDAQWRIPHFEKMLSDNALLLGLYSEAWRATGDGLFGRVAHETADWMLRELRSDDNGFYTALDADTEGHEGLFYTWDKDQVAALLDEEPYALVAERFGLNETANFEGRWHFYLANSIDQISASSRQDVAPIRQKLASAQAKLFAARSQRTQPFRDTKCVASLNALTLRGLALAARHLERDDLANAAFETIEFVQNHLWKNDRLYTSTAQGKTNLPGYLTDYAYLLDACIELLQLRWDSQVLGFAIELADVLLEKFYDSRDGGFFFTAEDHESLLHRMKTFTDDASPSGNGVAARALNRLGHLLADSRYLEAAERTLRLAWPALNSVPHGHCTMLDALDEILNPIPCVIVRAPADELSSWMPIAQATYAPGRLSFGIPDDATNLPEALSVRTSREGGVAYICEGKQCSAPITSAAKFSLAIKKLN